MSGKKMMVAAVAMSALGAFGEAFKWPPPPNGYSQDAPNIPKGTVSPSIDYPTRNHQNRPVRIYTPPGYDENRTEKYPVLYLHHGIGGNQNAWTSQPGSSMEGNADKVMNYLYAQPQLNVTPMIIVMPYGDVNGWDNYEDVLINDLIPYIEDNYNASSDKNMRAMAGLSWGGGQTLTYAYRHLDVFTWIGGFSPAPNAGSPANNIKDIETVKSSVHLNYFAGGNKPPSGGGFDERGFLATAKNYHDFLIQNGVTKVILQEEDGLDHERENWNRQLHHFAQRIFKLESTAIHGDAVQFAGKRSVSGNQMKWMPSQGKIGFLLSNENKAGIFSLDGRRISPLFQSNPSIQK